MTSLIAIDPGAEKSGVVILRGNDIVFAEIMENDALHPEALPSMSQQDRVAIEMLAHYGTGMPAGKSVFDTAVWVGRFQERFTTFGCDVELVFRKDVKLWLCGSTRAKDANVRQAIIDRYPATGGGKTPQVGTLSQPGPLYGITSHKWAALAIALYAQHHN